MPDIARRHDLIGFAVAASVHAAARLITVVRDEKINKGSTEREPHFGVRSAVSRISADDPRVPIAASFAQRLQILDRRKRFTSARVRKRKTIVADH